MIIVKGQTTMTYITEYDLAVCECSPDCTAVAPADDMLRDDDRLFFSYDHQDAYYNRINRGIEITDRILYGAKL